MHSLKRHLLNTGDFHSIVPGARDMMMIKIRHQLSSCGADAVYGGDRH